MTWDAASVWSQLDVSTLEDEWRSCSRGSEDWLHPLCCGLTPPTIIIDSALELLLTGSTGRGEERKVIPVQSPQPGLQAPRPPGPPRTFTDPKN